MTTTKSIQPAEKSTIISNTSNQNKGEPTQHIFALSLFIIGVLIAVAFAGIGTRSLMHNLRTLTMEELDFTIWAEGRPLFILWALSVPLGSILVVIGAFTYVKIKPIFSWLTGIGVLGAVIVMVMVWSRVYNSALFGIGGALILIFYFSIVWIWIKTYAGLNIQQKTAGSFRLIGYLFWINASWFLCGETAKMHLKAFEGSPVPSPIEIIVFLVLGWLFILIGEYKSKQLTMT